MLVSAGVVAEGCATTATEVGEGVAGGTEVATGGGVFVSGARVSVAKGAATVETIEGVGESVGAVQASVAKKSMKSKINRRFFRNMRSSCKSAIDSQWIRFPIRSISSVSEEMLPGCRNRG